MKKTLIILLLIAASAHADILKNSDPCTAIKNHLEAAVKEKSDLLAAAQKAVENAVFDPVEVEYTWTKAKIDEIKPGIATRLADAKLSPTQLDTIASTQVADIRKILPEAEFQAYLKEIFDASKAEALAELSEARKTLDAEADAHREEIRKSCGNGDLERVLRIVVDWAAKRTASEKTMDRKLVKLFTDISITDMQKYGLLGGPNSAARKAAMELNNAVHKLTGVSIRDMFKYGVLGGPNSDLRKIVEGADNAIHKATGIKLSDCLMYGILGGPHSDLRKGVNGVDEAIHKATGISLRDIIKHKNPLGGPNSDANKVWNGIKKLLPW